MDTDKILGLDLGTNSIGWAITERSESGYRLLDKGVDIFQEGVTREKGKEQPACSQRTQARASRRHYFRRRLRKIELLKVLIAHDFCPALTSEQLDDWRYHKNYPMDDAFLSWQRTDESTDKNPYSDRYAALTMEFDLSKRADRHRLGRALYHLAQRRGFLSNRKAQGDEDESGKVKTAIRSLSEQMKQAGCSYLGEYYYRLYQSHEKIREHHAARKQHYEQEFEAICTRQQLPAGLTDALHRAIFFQRPLKSQKGSVGTCTFEKGKPRCPISHPRYEEFRMLQFVNNIRIQTPADYELRPLTPEERGAIEELFLRKGRINKPHFDFEEIAKKLSGGKRGSYAHISDRCEAPYRFNYSMSTTVSGSPVTASLKNIFGDDWLATLCSVYVKGAGKSEEQILNDVWHALFDFADDKYLQEWGQKNLQLTDEQAELFAGIPIKQGYASLSLNAINKILPYLRAGFRYDEAVSLANLKAAVPSELWNNAEKRAEIEQAVSQLLTDFTENPATNREHTKEQCIADLLLERFSIPAACAQRLYHPSKVESYADARPDAAGILQLGSPRTSAVRNPMAMRALFRLRTLVNYLLREGRIDRHTKINIEMSRELNDANRRAAIEQDNREREKLHQKYTEAIQEAYRAETGRAIIPSEEDILKYQLYVEQNHICPYTGDQIGLTDFIGENPAYDIEHTVPRSRGGDNSQMNKTLCQSRYNRFVKRGCLPSELADHAQIMSRIEQLGWKEKIEQLDRQIQAKIRASKAAATKESKDHAIRDRHYLQIQRDYWAGKIERFTMTEVPAGFSNRQGVDIGIIGRYARMYLGTVFERVYPVKGATTAEFRKWWGLQEPDKVKERSNHVHHCIDAITIACIDGLTYTKWAQFQRDTERYEQHRDLKPRIEKPWPTFTEDVKAVAEELLIAHHTPNKMPCRSRKRMRVRGAIQRNEAGQIKYLQGDTARGALHQETFYGAIQRDDEIKYVVRKPLDSLQSPADVEKIVDEAVRQCVKTAIEREGFKEAISKPICFNAEKGVYIKKVRVFVPTVTQPISLKRHRDSSRFGYKRNYYVANDSNYCMAIYEGTDAKGKAKRTFVIKNNLEAARFFNQKANDYDLVPQSDENGYPLRYILRTGTMVLFYENSPEELYECTTAELSKRLYKITGISTQLIQKKYSYGVLTLRHHQEARPAGELKAKNGVWKIGENYRPLIGLLHTQLNMYVENYDFELTVAGEIKFKH